MAGPTPHLGLFLAELLAGIRLNVVEPQRGGLVDRFVEGELVEAVGLASESPAEFLGVGCAGCELVGQKGRAAQAGQPHPGG